MRKKIGANIVNKERLKQVGIDIDGVLERFMGNEALMERFLKRFEKDRCYYDLLDAVQTKDVEKAITASHTLKGVSANLSMTELYALTNKQVELLRDEKVSEAFDMMSRIQGVYEKLVTAIRGE